MLSVAIVKYSKSYYFIFFSTFLFFLVQRAPPCQPVPSWYYKTKNNKNFAWHFRWATRSFSVSHFRGVIIKGKNLSLKKNLILLSIFFNALTSFFFYGKTSNSYAIYSFFIFNSLSDNRCFCLWLNSLFLIVAKVLILFQYLNME